MTAKNGQSKSSRDDSGEWTEQELKRRQRRMDRARVEEMTAGNGQSKS